MKRSFVGIFVVVALVFATMSSFAGYENVSAVVRDDITVQLDDVVLSLKDANGNVVIPVVIDGTTYLPVRAISEALGVDVKWDGERKVVVLRSKERAAEDEEKQQEVNEWVENANKPNENTTVIREGKRAVGDWVESVIEVNGVRETVGKFRVKSVELEKNPNFDSTLVDRAQSSQNTKYRYKVITEGCYNSDLIKGRFVKDKYLKNMRDIILGNYAAFSGGFLYHTITQISDGGGYMDVVKEKETYFYPRWDYNENEIQFVYSVADSVSKNGTIAYRDEIYIVPLHPEYHGR